MKIGSEDHAQVALILVMLQRLGVSSFEMTQGDFDEALDHFFPGDKETGSVIIGYDDTTQKLSVSFPQGELQ